MKENVARFAPQQHSAQSVLSISRTHKGIHPTQNALYTGCPQFPKAVFCLRHNLNVDFGDSTLKILICTHSPLATLSMCSVWAPGVTTSIALLQNHMRHIYFKCKKHAVFLWHQADTTLCLLSLTHSRSCPDLHMSSGQLSSAIHHMTHGKNGFCTGPSGFSSTPWGGAGPTSWEPVPGVLEMNHPTRTGKQLHLFCPRQLWSPCSSDHLYSWPHCHFRLSVAQSQFKNLVILPWPGSSGG